MARTYQEHITTHLGERGITIKCRPGLGSIRTHVAGFGDANWRGKQRKLEGCPKTVRILPRNRIVGTTISSSALVQALLGSGDTTDPRELDD